MTPRGTDLSLAALVALLFTTGLLSLVSGHTDNAWVFTLHGVGGFALAFLTVVKVRRVLPRLHPRRCDRRTLVGMGGTVAVGLALASGWVWSSGGDLYVLGFNLLNWHITLGIALTVVVLWHALLRAKVLRAHDLANRRQFIHWSAMAAAAVAATFAQRPVVRAAGWRGATRRWTGSYEQASFEGNAFPATSWVADAPKQLPADTYRLAVGGLVLRPLTLTLADLAPRTTHTVTLDCTGGFFSTQHWHGVTLQSVLDQAGVATGATHVRVVSHTGYRWDFPLAEASGLLLASRVGDEPLSHAHGAPVRLVAPDRRGFQWIKWVTRIEVAAGPDAGSAASTLWSSFTLEGQGR